MSATSAGAVGPVLLCLRRAAADVRRARRTGDPAVVAQALRRVDVLLDRYLSATRR